MATAEDLALDSTSVAAGIADGASSESTPNGRQPESNASFAFEIQKKYAAERKKRIKTEGSAQYLELATSDRFSHMQDDPWVDLEPAIASVDSVVPDGRCKFLISGAGFGGLTFAVRLIEAGVDANDIRLLDTAGGFGGTWYWNRYPGLMCDIESYIYLPLLEKMDYMPKHKYSYGPELRRYTNLIADKWYIRNKTMFQTRLSNAKWREDTKEWLVDVVQVRTGHEKLVKQIHCQMLIVAAGLLNHPKIPRLPGLENFQGHMFHTSRWDFKYTGGSEENPSLENLRGKRVGILGTGATTIQVVPELAKWAKELYVFQRTPASVDERGQRLTDSSWWAETANKPGWQKQRNCNFISQIVDTYSKPPTNAVADKWTEMASYSALVGSPTQVTLETIPYHMANLHAIDLPRQDRIRARVDGIVMNPETASSLKAYYPSWCKRPCFHDDYLQSFNRPNVHLVDTDGKGPEGLTSTTIIANEKEYPLDVLIFSTGFRTPACGGPTAKANADVVGKDGRTMEDTFQEDGVRTLHGILAPGFPNFFFPGLAQAGVTPNFTFMIDQYATHAAYIVAESMRRASSLSFKSQSSNTINDRSISTGDAHRDGAVTPKKNFAIEPTLVACQAWTNKILERAASLAGMAGCTPGYINDEGAADRIPPEQRMKAAQRSPWGDGMVSYVEELERWRDNGEMDGIEFRAGA